MDPSTAMGAMRKGFLGFERMEIEILPQSAIAIASSAFRVSSALCKEVGERLGFCSRVLPKR